MELGRSAPMLTWASPGRAAAMVPAPVEGSEVRGHRQLCQILQHRQWRRSRLLAQRCGDRGTERSSEFGRVNHNLCPLARARGARRFQRAVRAAPSRTTGSSRRCGCWPTSPFRFSGLLFADSGATMELGRSAPMLTWASPGRAAAMVPAPVEGSEVRGHRQLCQILQHRQWRRSRLLAQRCGDRGTERSSEFGRVNHNLCPLARARGARRFQRAVRAAPSRTTGSSRRCGCWPTSPFRFSGLLFADSGATMELGRSAPMLTWASPGRAAAMVPAPVEGSEVRGHRQLCQILQHRQWRRSRLLAQRCGDRGTERSSEFGRVNHNLCPLARARGARRFQRAVRAAPSRTTGSSRRCGCWPTSPFRFSGLLFADSGATMELGRSAPMLTWASPGRAAAMVPAPVEGSEVRGHRQLCQILQHRQWRRSRLLAQRCGDRGTERSSEFGRVNHNLCPLARARGARRFQRAVRAAPSRTTGSSRRCGCWPTSPFRFSGLLFADSGATMELGRSAPMLTWASPGRAAAMVPAPVEGSEVRGHRQLCQILQHRQWRRSRLLAQRCGDRGTERSSEFGRVNHNLCPLARARGARRFQRAVRAAPSRTTGSSRRCGCWPTSPFRFSGLLFANSGATMELGRSAPMLTWASPGRAAAMVPAPVEGSEVRGHRQLCQILQHRQWRRSRLLAQRCGDRGTERSSEFGRVNHNLCPLARARGARRFQRAVRAAPSRTTGSSRRCGCWPTSPFRFSGLLFADSGATMELGRSAPMLTWASPGRAAAMVPAPVEGSEVRGHRQLCQILQHRQWRRSRLLAQRCGDRGTERSSEFGRVNHNLCPLARARGARRFQRAVRAAPSRTTGSSRRCGCWPTSPFRFSGLLFADSGATMELGRSAPMLTWASPGRAAAMVPAPVEGSEVRGHRQLCQILQHRQWRRSRLLAQRCGDRGTERSSEFGRVNHNLCPLARARGARRFQRAVRAAPSRTTGSSRRCGCWPTSPFRFSGLLFADSGATMELGRSAPMLTWASPGRAAAMVPAPVEGSEVRGHRQLCQILQHRQWRRSRLLAQRCGDRGTERSSEFGRVNHNLCPLARARGARRFQRAVRAAPSRTTGSSRRCGCWPTSPFRFSGLLFADSGATMELGRSAPMLTWASPGRAAAMVPAPVEGSEVRGHRQLCQILQHRQWRRSRLLAQRCGDRGTERSSEFGRVNHNLCPLARANSRETRRLLTNRPGSSFSTKSPIPTNVYASTIGLCKDSMIMQSRKPSNSDF